jgi:hypothetical protein
MKVGVGVCRVSSKQSISFFGLNRNKPKLNLFQLFFGLFRETQKNFRFVSMFWTGIETTKTNRTFLKQTKKNLQKTLSIRLSSKQLLFFGLNQNKPKLNLFWMFIGLCHENKKKNFAVCFGPVSKQPKQTELWYGELKRVTFNKFVVVSVGLLFLSVGLLFVSVFLKHRNSLF